MVERTQTNGTNGTHVNCAQGDSATPPPATEILAKFVHNSQYEDMSEDVIAALKDLLLDFIGVASAAVDKAESTEPVYRAVTQIDATLGGSGGRHTVFRKGRKFSAQTAALLNAFLGHSLDFDDTFTDGSVHPGVTAITAGLVAAESLNLDAKSAVDVTGKAFLTAVATGYEIACRISRAIGQVAYARGFHNTSTTGIFGAVAVISKLRKLQPAVIEMAFGLAGSKAAGSMQYLENGSWNKRLHPGFAVRDALMCVALAENGVLGATKIFEGRFGFFHMYAISDSDRKIDYDRLLTDLGSEWIFIATQIKPFPACRMTHGLIEMVDRLRTSVLSKSGSSAPSASIPSQAIKEIRIEIPPYQVPVIAGKSQNNIHPRNVVDAQFSAYYQVALTWLHGARLGWVGYDYLNDAELHSLTDRTIITPGPSLLRFQQHVTLEFEDGSTLEDTIRPPTAPGQQVQAPEYHTKLIDKFLSLAEPAYGAKKAKRIREVVEDIENHHLSELMKELL